MKIEDLPAPVTASKADWLAATTWLGFTPTDDNLNAINMCQSTIQRQFDNGYVIEYITEQFSEPNPGFERDPAYVQEREAHKDLAGRLIAVHRLRTTSRALKDVIGFEDFRKLQDMWAHDGKRCRWSVAFPIVETYKIIGHPKAKAVFGDAMYRRLYQRSSATLRVLNEHERVAIASLEIESLHTDNAWIGIEDEISFAEKSQIEPRTERLIREDLSDRALEGMMEERRTKIRRRAAWIAERFIRERRRNGKLICDHCAFDPKTVLDPQKVNPRSLLDVHHKNPMDEGIRYTTVMDFALLCPTCHRVEHKRLKHGLEKLATVLDSSAE
ncbi:HNH endonuclease [Pseudochrobactrum sp. AO18b]|uniref:HNH endonuclease n=1 Tax=Pseudochrobactrum sp. AO18b TaxID=1201036 RepID=UPI00039FD8DE|nr:HNH endonuclease [Pseudochrobactrum sp. AO18b]